MPSIGMSVFMICLGAVLVSIFFRAAKNEDRIYYYIVAMFSSFIWTGFGGLAHSQPVIIFGVVVGFGSLAVLMIQLFAGAQLYRLLASRYLAGHDISWIDPTCKCVRKATEPLGTPCFTHSRKARLARVYVSQD